jgi:membrane-associated phospholipid phosphatase
VINRLVGCSLFLVCFGSALSQADSLSLRADIAPRSADIAPRPRVTSLIVPAVLTAYGFAALKWEALKTFDRQVREEVWVDNPHHPFHLDNYLQYGPGAAVYALNAAGVHGRHNFRDRTIIYLVGNAMMGAAVLSLKNIIHAPRPDGSGNDGFPSGHTATAFVGAEFMRQEFGGLSVGYTIAGYAMATGTGFLRVYNDKHWFSELTTGAGIGMLTGKAAYWLFPLIERKLKLTPKPAYRW